jgi:hypothetical protein
MWPRERVEAVFGGRPVDRVPFTAYENKTCPSQVERELRNGGMCILERRISTYTRRDPAISEEAIYFRGSDGFPRRRRVIQTPKGVLTEVSRIIRGHTRIPEHSLPWIEEFLFKGPADYPALEYMVGQRQYQPTYDEFRRSQEEAGGDVLLVQSLGKSPLQDIIYNLMGVEQFAVEWHERRDDLLHLYDLLTEDRRKTYPLIAHSPAWLATYGGNVSPEIVGVERFRKYIAPHYNELSEMLHEGGKQVMVHFDGPCAMLAEAIGELKIDCVEAFTPLPTGDMSLAEARQAWPDKVLWVNFPSAVHLEDDATVEAVTRQLLSEAGAGERLLIGITENVPDHRWQASFLSIQRVLNREGILPLTQARRD